MDYHCERVNQNGIVFIFKISVGSYLFFSLLSQLDKFKRVDFGRCPRVLYASQPLLPVGLTDIPYEKSAKLFCERFEDLYSPKSS